MTRRALALAFGAGWLALLLMRVTVNYAGGSPLSTLPRVLSVVAPTTAFWIPVIAVVLWLQRRSGFAARQIMTAHATIAIAVVFIEPLVAREVLGRVGIERYYLTMFIGRLDTNALIYALIVSADVALHRFAAFRAREIAAARLEQALADAQLHALAIQLQPHFLFNALQFVAETAHEDLRAARRTLGHLRELVAQAFRLESRVEVSLDEELSFLDAYSEIQRNRFGDRFRLTTDLDEAARGARVPPLLLQPLVENASRHGFSKRSEGGHVIVSARADGGRLSIVVCDDGIGPAGPVVEGQGLSVTRRRLERLHGGAAHLSLARTPEGRTEARLGFPLNPMQRDATPSMPIEMMSPTSAAATLEELSPRLTMGWRIAVFWAALMALVFSATAIAVTFGPLATSEPLALTGLIADEVVGFPFWLAMTIAAVVGARRLRGPFAVPAHLAIAIGLALAHVFLGDDVSRLVFGEAAPRAAYQQWATWDVLVYGALVVVARAHDLREWARARMREEVTLNAQVVQANERLARLRAMQTSLLAMLDDVIASPTMETLDRAVIEFADYLRGQLAVEADSPEVVAG